ncbi:uncharacterized protein LOC9660078 [Selaginella moellendorffii]|uniref:uncharacterized protein LOC9660078 n=1 Tax=Selaginella moellendorffii TaxID=88036 RepID=UPI000D1CAF6B|nr:uncharacterized protein LOC9660078 [Selaginella moellendorffii]|eukprot:XP_024530197.1 uncharacterized protein LOC9660078 [Selaginella moellendorffii]
MEDSRWKMMISVMHDRHWVGYTSKWSKVKYTSSLLSQRSRLSSWWIQGVPALSGYDPFRCKWAVLFQARMSATFVAVDEEHEIAMLQIEKDMPFLPVSTELMKLGRRSLLGIPPGG